MELILGKGDYGVITSTIIRPTGEKTVKVSYQILKTPVGVNGIVEESNRGPTVLGLEMTLEYAKILSSQLIDLVRRAEKEIPTPETKKDYHKTEMVTTYITKED